MKQAHTHTHTHTHSRVGGTVAKFKKIDEPYCTEQLASKLLTDSKSDHWPKTKRSANNTEAIQTAGIQKELLYVQGLPVPNKPSRFCGRKATCLLLKGLQHLQGLQQRSVSTPTSNDTLFVLYVCVFAPHTPFTLKEQRNNDTGLLSPGGP